MNGRFSGRVALVAGGTGGLGRAVSLALLEESASVVVTYRRQEEFDALRRDAGGNEARLQGQRADVTDESAAKQLIETIVASRKSLDILVNAVGGFAGGVTFWEADSKSLDQMLALNLRSGYALLRAAVPVMLRQNRGAIVNVASTAAVSHGAGLAAYAASKAAAVAMVNSLAADLKDTPVRVNSILPSIIDTETNRRAMPGADFSKWPKPAEIARVILFLCSDDAKLIRGASISV